MIPIADTVFNVNKTDYTGTKSLFLGQPNGLFDSINKSHPAIWELYKKMKSLDWDENEFPYADCALEFKTCSRSVYEMMIKTLASQWEADSLAAHNLIPIVAPFVSSSELWALYCQIGNNEILHSLTYSEIVRNSFENPDVVMTEILEESEALRRIHVVANAMAEVKAVGLQLQTGEITRHDYRARDAAMLFVYTLLGLERIQFMASFGVTFAIAESGMFLPIGQAVKKICADELNIHVETGKAIITNELQTPEGQASFLRIKSRVQEIYDEITRSELRWCRYMFSEGRELVGMNLELLENWSLFNANDVYHFTGIENPFKVIKKNPIPFINDWIDLNNHQASPQEEKTSNYLLGGLINDAGDKVFDVDF